MRPLKVRYLPGAIADIDRVRDLLNRRNPAAARRILAALRDAIERLGANPGLGHQGLAPGTHEWVVSRTPYVIVYDVDTAGREVIVVAVMHWARQGTPD